MNFLNLNASRIFNAYQAVSNNYNKQERLIGNNKKYLSGADLSKEARYQGQVKSLNAAKNNTQDSVSLLNATNTGLSTIETQLNTIRTNFENGTAAGATALDQDTAQTNINNAINFIDNTVTNTTSNNFDLLRGTQDIDIQTGTNTGDTFTLFLAQQGSIDQKGIAIDITEESGGNDRGNIVEDISSIGFALDELSVGSSNVSAYDGGFYTATTDGLNFIDQASNNIRRMKAQVSGIQSGANAFLSMLQKNSTDLTSALNNLNGIDVELEIKALDEIQEKKTSIEDLIKTITTSNETVYSLLP